MFPTMARKRPDKPDDSKPPESKAPLKPVVGFRAEPDLHAALELLAADEQRKMAQMIAILVKEAMIARGKWAPPPRPGKQPRPRE